MTRTAARGGTFRYLPVRVAHRQSWTDGQRMLSLPLLNILGRKRADDLEEMETDMVLCRLASRHEARIPGVSRWSLRPRQRKIPSPRSLPDWRRSHEDKAASRARPEG